MATSILHMHHKEPKVIVNPLVWYYVRPPPIRQHNRNVELLSTRLNREIAKMGAHRIQGKRLAKCDSPMTRSY